MSSRCQGSDTYEVSIVFERGTKNRGQGDHQGLSEGQRDSP